MSVGFATCLKVFPGLLLVYFVFRHRRAFAAAALTMLVLAGMGGAIVGWQNHLNYLDADRFAGGEETSRVFFPHSRDDLGFLRVNTRILLFCMSNSMSSYHFAGIR